MQRLNPYSGSFVNCIAKWTSFARLPGLQSKILGFFVTIGSSFFALLLNSDGFRQGVSETIQGEKPQAATTLHMQWPLARLQTAPVTPLIFLEGK